MSDQFNFNKFNDLINSARDAVMCNSECQRQRKEEQLKQNYLNAQTNLTSASSQEQTAQKNYIIFTKGEPAYNDFLDNQLQEKAQIIADKYTENFNEESKKITNQISSYNGLLINFHNVVDLYTQYKNENVKLFKELKDESNDVLTNERKTYYEDQNIGRLKNFYLYFLITIYVIFVLCFAVFSLIYPSNTSWKIRLALLLVFILLPFISTWILAKIIYYVYELYNFVPKNVYLSRK